MRVPSWLLPAEILLLVGSIQFLPVATASSVDIRVEAAFDSAPYLVELLETAADENQEVYFKILDRIAEGHFSGASTNNELYDRFVRLLQDDDLIRDPVSLSAFDLALSIHNAAPRIEAHYQYYETAVQPLLTKSGAKDCETWLQFGGGQFCSPQFEKKDASIQGLQPGQEALLPFDRQDGQVSSLPAVLYADITSSDFTKFHKLIKDAANAGKVSYRVRHKPPKGERPKTQLSGYGAELALKRTDYIVIDDREKGDAKKPKKAAGDAPAEDDEVADLTPLSSSELEGLSMKAAAYVLDSEVPLKRLLKVTQDFPKYSSFLSAQEVPQPFVKEHTANREQLLPSGLSVMWINGVQYDPRKMDPYSLLDHMKRERKLIAQFNELGFDNAEAIHLLTHPSVAEAQRDPDVARYDWRDTTEGGNVIIWLNDIEKDKRYEEWPQHLMALLQRTYPGQMPSVRRDIHNLILPVDFSEPRSVAPIIETVQDFVKRKIPVRFGIVPMGFTPESEAQGRVAYHLFNSYGLSALMEYLESSMAAREVVKPHEASFKSSFEKRKLKPEKEERSLQQVLEATDAHEMANAKQYLTRLGAKGETAPLFINGVPIKNDDEWLQTFSQRVSMDMRVVQRQVYENTLDGDSWVPELFLKGASLRRNALVIPEDEKQIKLISLLNVYTSDNQKIVNGLPRIPAEPSPEGAMGSQLVVAADFETDQGIRMVLNAMKFREDHPNVEVLFVATGKTQGTRPLYVMSRLSEVQQWNTDALLSVAEVIRVLLLRREDFQVATPTNWPDMTPLLDAFGFKEGEAVLVLNGRKVGPIPADEDFTFEDFETLYRYEVKKRSMPAAAAVQEFGFQDKVEVTADAAKLISILSLSTVSDMPEGIFEAPPPIRTRLFYGWNSSHTAITHGDNSTAAIHVVATMDPASEIAQRWTPVLKVLSELEGVYLRLFMNPRESLQELPIKRFYRYALDAKPRFDSNGATLSPHARFEKLPKDALLTAGMDLPASWLVAPKDSVHDLDNIKLSSLANDVDVEATYELENILIEGHSRDSSIGIPPRGAQLALSTAKDERFADTIIMSNLGYFQFKANPGYFNISLLPGASQRIFNIDSVGALGYEPVAGDNTTEVTMMSFQGVTLYPRLSRKPGMEDEDVLGTPEEATGAVEDLVSRGAEAVDGLLSKVGIKRPPGQTGKLALRTLKSVQSLLNKPADTLTGAVATASPHAEINIFSVASGHLYERMLNIMMLSVMKHTKHTVKFWFIEQFLSPSFKSFLPTLAAEYGFQFEMVTYKWPHWLRAQKEKQREIWGYKILFLDVLFPLDLDKVIFVDADQIVRTDMIELVNHNLEGAPYGFTPMCDSRTEMEGFRFWKQGYWKNFLRGLPYHISALYVVDLKRFRQIAAGDRLRQQYHQLSADPNSLSNLDQDLPNNMQMMLPIHSLPQEWLWCETWCSDESLKDAKTIDLCNNPQTKEPKLDRARRQVPEWNEYDSEIAALAEKTKGAKLSGEEQQQIQKDEEAKEGKPREKDEL